VSRRRNPIRPAAATRPAGRRLRETAEFFAFMQEEVPALLGRWRARRSG
jgi:hypothetical protein